MKWEKLLNESRVRDLGNKIKNQVTDHEKKDPRSEFQRDYDRCLFSTPVRRLQDKAQVFPLEVHDSVRTRLTHSLEVSNISKAIVKRIGGELLKKNHITDEQLESIVCISKTCGLIHDLGNPPFGHSGEDAMRDWFRAKIDKMEGEEIKFQSEIQKKDFLYFEGNAQTLRLLSKLQMLGDFSGLNLTVGTMSAARKYLASSVEIKKKEGQSYEKLGFFQSEEPLMKLIENESATEGARHPIAFIVEAADDIVYSIIDLEDALKKKVLSWNFIRNELYSLIPDLLKYAEKNVYDRAVDQGFDMVTDSKELNKIAKKLYAKDQVKIEEFIYQKSEFLQLKGQALSEARMSILRTKLIAYNIEGAVEEFLENYDDIMNGSYKGELVQNKKINKVISKCKATAFENVFQNSDILKLEIMGRNIIHDLMNHFWEGINKYPYDVDEEGKKKRKKYPFHYKIYTLLSENYRTVFEQNYSDPKGIEPIYLKLQLLADYICGMTDSFAKELHREVYNG